ncbi:MAG: YggT family protein [Alphaproteobacteria bacterium]|jgi:YggT family protein|nr:YggT family protein [Alphaproteobacteria bacterium]MBT5390499.1 YggT family protein [Alphaproteobacteria bacterium]MBT5540603.1 YggT family protein [Alphaproteobacteria bacterium]MBT5654839.1 YggT family protein [Alphaproteobacteria bacterium]
MEVILIPLLALFNTLVNLYVWAIIIYAVLTVLISLDVVNKNNRFVFLVGGFLFRITDPTLRIVRRFLPNLGGVDLSPIVVIIGLYFVQAVLNGLVHRLLS